MKHLIVIVSLLLIGCSSGASRNPGLDEGFKLAYASQQTIADEKLTLTFTEINEDSRCPSDVQCIQAGRATITLSLIRDGAAVATRTLTLPGAETATYLNYSITLLELAPYPVSTHQTTASEHVATLVVARQP